MLGFGAYLLPSHVKKMCFSACLERGCEHNCIPPETEDDTATCACLEGYILNEDGVSCDGKYGFL